MVPVFLHGSFLRGGVPTWNNPRLVVNDEQAADLSLDPTNGRRADFGEETTEDLRLEGGKS